jgi:hypothetical protein
VKYEAGGSFYLRNEALSKSFAALFVVDGLFL